ncbi:hypothetical protein ACHQM5_020301 [Ranunculus cassubicifolius]
MASDEDFTLIGDENHDHHLDLDRFPPKSHPPPPNQKPDAGDDDGYRFSSHDNKSLQTFLPFPISDQDHGKRKSLDELSDDGGNSNSVYLKKSRNCNSDGEYRVEVRPDYRKDREEWSDTAIGSLLDAYTEKYVELNRGNLRGRDWEEVASTVSGRCNKQRGCKSVEQCKNKVDNLKKRYKVERQRMQSYGAMVSHWPWFKKIEHIVSNNSATTKAAVSDDDDDDDKSGSGSAIVLRPNKRYSIPIASPSSLTNNTKSKSMANPRWRRVVFKISGAALAGNGPQNIDPKVAMLIAKEVSIACRLGVEVAIVVGGRNFFCGDSWVAATSLDRSTAYQIGMMATVMNSILIQSALEKLGIQTRVQSSYPMQEPVEPYNKRRAIRHLEKGRVVIFGGVGAGTGNPLFTTDTASALRASELNAEALLKGTNLDGGVTFEHISFRDLVSRGVTAMDMMAITFCEENGVPVVLFNLLEPGNISRALCGQQIGTLIDQAGSSS